MKTKAVFLFTLIWASSCFAGEDGFELKYEPANVKYTIYGLGLGDPIKPTAKDSKIAFHIEGKAAKKIFDSIPPNRRDDGCVGDGYQLRSRDNDKFSCVKYNDGTYTCTFGFDLKTGKSIAGSVC